MQGIWESGKHGVYDFDLTKKASGKDIGLGAFPKKVLGKLFVPDMAGRPQTGLKIPIVPIMCCDQAWLPEGIFKSLAS